MQKRAALVGIYGVLDDSLSLLNGYAMRCGVGMHFASTVLFVHTQRIRYPVLSHVLRLDEV